MTRKLIPLLATLLVALPIAYVSIQVARADDPSAARPPRSKPTPAWIGVMCHMPSEALRSQLALPENEGLVVANIVPGSPAAEAGIQRNDVLLQAAKQPLTHAGELSRIVVKNGEQPLAIEVLRAGQRQTVTVKPLARPDRQPPAVALPGPDQQALREWIERVAPPAGDAPPAGNRRFRLRFLHPGLILGNGDLAANFPKDLSITFNRAGDEPLKITVEKDGETWEVNRDEMGKLPQNLLPFVERMLGDRGVPDLSDLDLDIPDVGAPNVALPDIQLPGVDLPGGGQSEPPARTEPGKIQNERATPVDPPAPKADRQLEQLHERLRQLEQQLKELQQTSDDS